MPRFCGVINCSNREMKEKKKRFFRLPAALKLGNNIKQVLSSRRRSKWIIALRRADLTETKLKYLWVCEDHFVSGKPADLWDSDDIDWVPSQLMGYETDESNIKGEQDEEMHESKLYDDNVPSDDSNDSLSYGKRLLNMEKSNSVFIHFLSPKRENEALTELNKRIRRKEITVDKTNETNNAVKEIYLERKSVCKEVQTDLTMEDVESLMWASREFLLKSITITA